MVEIARGQVFEVERAGLQNRQYHEMVLLLNMAGQRAAMLVIAGQ